MPVPTDRGRGASQADTPVLHVTFASDFATPVTARRGPSVQMEGVEIACGQAHTVRGDDHVPPGEDACNVITPRPGSSGSATSAAQRGTRTDVVTCDESPLQSPGEHPVIESTVVDVPFLLPPAEGPGTGSLQQPRQSEVSVAAIVSSPQLDQLLHYPVSEGRKEDQVSSVRGNEALRPGTGAFVDRNQSLGRRGLEGQTCPVADIDPSANDVAAERSAALHDNSPEMGGTYPVTAAANRTRRPAPTNIRQVTPEQERESKRNMQEILSRLERKPGGNGTNKGNNTAEPSSTRSKIGETDRGRDNKPHDQPGHMIQFSSRSRHAGKTQKTPVTQSDTADTHQLSSRNTHARATTFYTPRLIQAKKHQPPSHEVENNGRSSCRIMRQDNNILVGISSDEDAESDSDSSYSDALPRRVYYDSLRASSDEDTIVLEETMEEMMQSGAGSMTARHKAAKLNEDDQEVSPMVQASTYKDKTRGLRSLLAKWKYQTELKNLHCHLLAVGTRRSNQRCLRKFVRDWCIDALESARWSILMKRQLLRSSARLLTAYVGQWKLYAWGLKCHRRILRRVLMRDATVFLFAWLTQVAHSTRLRARLQRLKIRKQRLVMLKFVRALRGVKQVRLLHNTAERCITARHTHQLVVFLHAWSNLCVGCTMRKVCGKRILQRQLDCAKHSRFQQWVAVHDEVKLQRGRNLKAKIRIFESLATKFMHAWCQRLWRVRTLSHAANIVLARRQNLLAASTFKQFHVMTVANTTLRTALTALLLKHMNRVLFGVMRTWFAMIYDIRMSFRSKMLKMSYSQKELGSIFDAWHLRSVVNARRRRKLRLMFSRSTVALQQLAMSGWRRYAHHASGRRHKVTLTRKRRRISMFARVLQHWVRLHAGYISRITSVAGWALSRQVIISTAKAVKNWKFHVEEQHRLLVVGERVVVMVRVCLLSRHLFRWCEVVAAGVRRSLEFERARFRVNRTIMASGLDRWLYHHGRSAKLSRGISGLVHRNLLHCLREHFCFWHAVIESHLRRKILVDRFALRSAYTLAGRVLRRWSLLEGGHVMRMQGGVKSIDKAQVLTIMTEQKRATKCFTGLKAWVLVAGLHNRVLAALRVSVNRRIRRQVFSSWIHLSQCASHERYIGQAHERVVALQVGHSILRATAAIFEVWRILTAKRTKVAKALACNDGLLLRGVLCAWKKGVQVHLAFALKVRLAKLGLKRYTRLMRGCFLQLFRQAQTSHRLKSVYSRCMQLIRRNGIKRGFRRWRHCVCTLKTAGQAANLFLYQT